VLVVSAARIGLLSSAIGGDADRVAFADMADVGANPARIIPAWRDFVAAVDGGRGLWMVNQLCDLVQLRSFPDGAAVRVHMYLP
jgi:hypothetical protein